MFGKAAIANRDYVATGLRLLDVGMAGTDLAQFALDQRLGAGASNEAVVTLLYSNAMSATPGALELDYFTGLLQARQYTPTSLAIMVLRSPENSVNIDLMGLAWSGVEYTTAS